MRNRLDELVFFVRNEGAVIRHNMGWTLFLLAYLILIAVLCYFLFPSVVSLPFKLLLFVAIDGWGQLAQALVSGYHTS